MIKKVKYVIWFILLLLSLVFILPIIFVTVNSFMSSDEVLYRYSQFRNPGFIPFPATLQQFFDILVKYPVFIYKFWVSIRMSLIITVFSVIFSTLAGLYFAKSGSKLSKFIMYTYAIVMLIPFSVTLLPNYMQARWLGIYDTELAVILPTIFSPLGAIFMTAIISFISNETLEAAVIETNSVFKIITKIIVPQVKWGIAVLSIIIFAESWNMIEQPYILIQDESLRPLSVMFNKIIDTNLNVAFAASLLYLLPVIICFLYFEDAISEIIGFTKE